MRGRAKKNNMKKCVARGKESWRYFVYQIDENNMYWGHYTLPRYYIGIEFDGKKWNILVSSSYV